MGWKQYLSIRSKSFHPVCQKCQVSVQRNPGFSRGRILPNPTKGSDLSIGTEQDSRAEYLFIQYDQHKQVF